MDLALRPDRWPFCLEKWYVDLLLDDGGVLLVYLARMRLLGVTLARVTAEFFPPEGPVIRGDAPVPHVEGAMDRLLFGPATLDGDTLAFDTPGLSGRLRYHPLHDPVTLRTPFLEARGRSLDWVVEIPDAEVEGELRWPGGTRAVMGRGYRDRVRFDLPPWRFPIRELVWGRAVCGPHAATWVQADTLSGRISARWVDGVVDEGEGPPVELGPDRVLLDAHVVDLETLRLGALRPLLRLLSGDPAETKRAASASLEGFTGRAIHETVRWT
jgi:hypothetical protein